MKIVYLLIFCLVISLNLLAKDNVYISGNFTSAAFDEIPLTRFGLNYLTQETTDFLCKVDKKGNFKFSFNLKNSGFYRLGDGWFGHIIFIQPNDTVFITLTPYTKQETNNGAIFYRTFNKMKVIASHSKNYSFFDELYLKTKLPIKYKLGKELPNIFKSRCDNAQNIGIQLLESNRNKKMITDTFYRYAKSEINSLYILSLCEILIWVPKTKLPSHFFDNIRIKDFSDENIASKTDKYITAVSVYNIYIANDYDTHIRDYSNLNNEFAWANSKLKGIVRDRILTWVVDDYKDKGFLTFDSLFNVYLETCKTPKLRNYAKTKIDFFKKTIKIQSLAFRDLIIQTKVINIKGDTLNLSSILNENSHTIIDFWATWCKPCLASKPSFENAAMKFNNKLGFVSISTDMDYDKWRKFLKPNKFINEYFLVDNFKSPLSLFINLETIPRYISISKINSKIIDKNLIRPEFKSEFYKILNSYTLR